MCSLESLLELPFLWEHLSATEKPVVLYGMGDGADKILNVCEQKGIPVQGVFASDEFVRGQSFRGFTVKTYADTKKGYPEPIILVSFASRLDNVMERIYELSVSDELYAPDVPVFGDGLFDSDYFKAHFDDFSKVYSLLFDELSKKAYYDILAYKLTGRLSYLKDCETPVSEAYGTILRPGEHSVYADIGAYNGDTVREYLSYAGNDTTVYAFEPDARNYKKLCENVRKLPLTEAHLYHLAAWNQKTELTFYARSGRNSASSTSHAGAKATIVEADRVDAYLPQGVDVINIDAEGADMRVLEGLSETIDQYKPTISCAVYHRNEDMFAIPLYLAEQYGSFRMYLRHFPYIPAWDTNIYIKKA